MGRSGKRGGKVTHKIWNASNVLGGIAFLSMIAAVGAAEWAIENNGTYWTTMAFIAVLAVCAYLSIKEDGKIR